MPLLFAYDTFIRSGNAHHLLSESHLIANATAKEYDIYTIKNCTIKYLALGKNNISGEVYDVKQDIIDYLNRVGTKLPYPFIVKEIIVYSSTDQEVPCLYYTIDN